MRLFSCPACGAPLHFRNLECACGAEAAFDPEAARFVPADKPCANRAVIQCNWVVEAAPGAKLCRSCRMTKVIPEKFQGENLKHWAVAERAKRWVLATLARWGWLQAADTGPRPVFHLLAEQTSAGEATVTMGHLAGVVTINVTEADAAERAQRREELGERLRTMTGHFRHELAHFFFERFTPRPGFLEAFRELFGDERADYASALETYYKEGPPEDWKSRHVTRYAASHPHEDWAESFAHLLHLTDIADSFLAVGLSSPDQPEPDYDAYAETDSERLIEFGEKLGLSLNHTNRAMGLPGIYPFVLTPEARRKLAFVHQWIRAAG